MAEVGAALSSEMPSAGLEAAANTTASAPDSPNSPATTPDEESPEHSYQPLNRLLSEASGATFRSDGSTTTIVGTPMACGHFLGAVANLCSATLGAGILALPFAMYESGLVFGFLLLLASAWATAASIDLIVQACDFYGLKTYETVVEKALGSKWRQLVEISILIFCGGTAVAYVIAVGDIMERVGDSTHKRLAMSLVWLLAMLPLSCLRKMQSLQCASSVGIMSIGTLLVAATVHLVMPMESEQGSSGGFWLGRQDLELFLWPKQGGLSILRACPIFFFAYSCQVNVAQIYEELPGPRVVGGVVSATENDEISRGRVRSMSWVAWVAIGLCTTLYASISYVTLMDFGDQVKPNILSCYRLSGRESALLHLAFLAMALAVIMAFPLNVFPARVSIIQMWEAAFAKHSGEPMMICIDDPESRQPLISKHDDRGAAKSTYKSSENNNRRTPVMDRGHDEDDPLEPPRSSTQILSHQSTLGDESQLATGEYEEEPEFHSRQHQVVTLLVAGSALGLALVIPNISVVFGLLGGTTSSLLGFVVPGMLGLAMDGPTDHNKTTSRILVVAGTLIGVVTTGVTVYSTVKESLQ